MRIRLARPARRLLFTRVLQATTQTQRTLAAQLGVSDRTLREWRFGHGTIPARAYVKLRSIADLQDLDLRPERLSQYWYVSKAAQKGAAAYQRLYGNPGTPEGRRRGGLNSLQTHARLRTSFKILKIIKHPRRSLYLAELLGILFGDGHLAKFQVEVTTNSKTDWEHALHTKRLINKLFGIAATIRKKTREQAVTVVASSKRLVEFLHKLGMPKGNKISGGIKVPDWIWEKVSFQKSFIRGLFDTDGCVYLECHNRKDKKYKYIVLAITSYAKNLQQDIVRILRILGFTPTHRDTQHSIFLRRSKEVQKFFSTIGTHNPKHKKRYTKFLGEVA